MPMICHHPDPQPTPFILSTTAICTLPTEKFNEYAAAIRAALLSAPKRKLTSEQLRKAAELPAGKLLPVTEEMLKNGELHISYDYSTSPPSHLYSLTSKGKSKL